MATGQPIPAWLPLSMRVLSTGSVWCNRCHDVVCGVDDVGSRWVDLCAHRHTCAAA